MKNLQTFQEFLNESSNTELKIGDVGIDYNDTENKVVDIVTKKELKSLFKSDYDEDEVEDFDDSDLFYVTVCSKSNPDVPVKKGQKAFYPVIDKSGQYWDLSKK